MLETKSLSDKHCSGAPKSGLKQRLISNMKQHVENDPNISVCQLSVDLDVSISTVHKVLHDELSLKETSARWLPHFLTDFPNKLRVKCNWEITTDV